MSTFTYYSLTSIQQLILPNQGEVNHYSERPREGTCTVVTNARYGGYLSNVVLFLAVG